MKQCDISVVLGSKNRKQLIKSYDRKHKEK